MKAIDLNNEWPKTGDQDRRVEFLVELARSLHRYGTAAGRLEGAVNDASRRLGVRLDVWALATGQILSVFDPADPSRPITRVIRMDPGSVDLGRLARADNVAGQVTSGSLSAEDGVALLRAIDIPDGVWRRIGVWVGCCLTAAAVIGFTPHTGSFDVWAAVALSMMVALGSSIGETHKNWREAMMPLAGFAVTLAAGVIDARLQHLHVGAVIVAALIGLMPGLALTTAIVELGTNHLASGSARLAGAMVQLLKMAFGVALAQALLGGMGLVRISQLAASDLPVWFSGGSALMGGLAFALLFRARARDTPVVAASAAAGFSISWLTQTWLGVDQGLFALGAFVAALVMTAASNCYARVSGQPGALVRVPGIILLVPGGLAFKAVTGLDVISGVGVMGVISVLVSVSAGILIGNVVWPPRSSI